MSALPADLQLRSRRDSDSPNAPRLRSVPAPQPRLGGVGFVLLLGAILAAGMFGLVMLNTQIQDQAFELSTLRKEVTMKAERESALLTELNTLSSAKDLGDRASKLGMVPAVNVGILSLSDGRLTGAPKPVSNFDLKTIRTPAQIEAAEAAAKAKAEADRRKAAEEAAKKASPTPAPQASIPTVPPPPTAPTPPPAHPTQTTGR